LQSFDFLFRGTGGPVIAILLILSVIALALSIQKIALFTWRRVGRHANARQAMTLWFEGDQASGHALVVNDRAPLSVVLRHAMIAKTHREVDDQVKKDDVRRVAIEQLVELRSGIRAIELIGQTAPLLGLFGTVLGMIEAFSELEAAGSAVDPAQLAGGIWTALLTTAVGLAVAIPFSVIASLLDGRLDRERLVIESTLTGFLANRISEHQNKSFEVGTIIA